MEMDLENVCYNSAGYKEYIYGSAEVVGLMCLYVFCEGDKANVCKTETFCTGHWVLLFKK